MINKNTGDLLSVTEGYIVHGCNAQGVMGSGVAKLIKDNYQEAYHYYHGSYKSFIKTQGKMPIGINIYAASKYNNKLCIVNAITQEFYGRDKNIVYVDYNAVRKCFNSLNSFILEETLKNIPKVVNFPLIGAGLANGDWSIIEQIIDEELDSSIIKNLWIL
jgi:O-acetyl-ADP-ribose deacetylase (regulator of RNase III)